MISDKAKYLSTAAVMLYLTATTVYKGYKEHKRSQTRQDMIQRLKDLSAPVHDIAKNKSDLSFQQKLDVINEARQLRDRSMYGEVRCAELSEDDIVHMTGAQPPQRQTKMDTYLQSKAVELHKEMHHELRRQSNRRWDAL